MDSLIQSEGQPLSPKKKNMIKKAMIRLVNNRSPTALQSKLKKIEEKEDNVEEIKRAREEKKAKDKKAKEEMLLREKHAMFKKVHHRSFIVQRDNNYLGHQAAEQFVHSYYKHYLLEKDIELEPLSQPLSP